MGKRKMDSDLHSIKLETGTVYQTSKGGNYYFRFQVKGERKCISLKTANQEEAVRKAKELLPTVQASNLEVIATHVKVARNLVQQRRSLPVNKIWEVYSKHPDKATPATIHEELSYQATLQEFLDQLDRKITQFSQITAEHAVKFASFLKESNIAVSTHNRKIIRLRKIFSTLQSYREESNPFEAKSLRRKPREEQDNVVRRIPFTREEEERLRQMLDDPAYKVMNKSELKTVFYIGLYTGQRLKDAVLARWDQVDLENRRIFVKQFKTGKEVSIPLAEPLWKLLTEVKDQNLSPVYISPNVAARYKTKDAKGKIIGDNYVSIDVMRVISWLGLPTSVEIPGRNRKVTVRGFHSLRHSFCTHCAEAGVPKAVVVSILGAESSILDRIYTHVGADAQLAAIEAVSGTSNSTPHIRIKKALEYIASIPEPSESSGEKAASSIQACINLYGVMDFAGFRTGSGAGKYRTQVMGFAPDQNRAEWIRCSPVELVDANDPPMLQIYASADKVVHFRQAELMKKELDRHGVYNEYILLDGFGHVFNLQRWRGKPLPRIVRQRVLAFYDRFLKNLSPEEAEKRFIALEKFEKAHPKSAYYGISTLSNGKVDNTKQGFAIVSSGRKSRFEAAFDMKLEKLTQTEITAFCAGRTVIVSGKKGADGTLECQQIVFPGKDSKGISGIRGILKKCDDGWTLEVKGKKTVKLNITAATRIYNCIPVKMKEIKSGWRVRFLQVRNYGDLCKIVYGLFAD